MKIEVGMYVRFEGMINKIIEIEDNYIVFEVNWYDHWADEVSSMNIDRFVNDYNPKSSFNIIDLIEVGDYVNGVLVDSVPLIKKINMPSGRWRIVNCTNEDIKSIVTREAFENMSYKVS